jgi:hypothetical protein
LPVDESREVTLARKDWAVFYIHVRKQSSGFGRPRLTADEFLSH